MDVVGGEAFSAFFQVLFQQLGSKHVVDSIRWRDIKKEVDSLKKAGRKVIRFLNDAENKQYKDELVKKWLDDLRDASYDAEDVIDEIATEAKTSSDQRSFLIQAVNSTPGKIKAIVNRFNTLEKEGSDLGLKEIVVGTSFFRETSSVVDESRVYRMDVDKAKILDQLLKEDNELWVDESHVYGMNDDKENILLQLFKEDIEFCRIISIVGMGGVGKTTLAQLVYNDNRVKNHFDLQAWVCVLDDFDIKGIMKAILESVTLAPCRFKDLNSLQVGVKEALTGKKFLIILDDVWNKNYGNWERLRTLFGGVAGSAIIVTTRDNEIASMMGTVGTHPLRQLSDDDCWRVFAQRAFVGIKSVDANPDLVAIGKEIVRKCKGLPLVAGAVGSALRTRGEYEWKKFLNCIIEEESGIPQAFESWQKGGFLGSGSFGTVYKGYANNGLFFAVKEVSLLDQGSRGQQSIRQLEQEITLLSKFNHENVVQYLGTDKDEGRLYIFLELVTEGSLESLYQKYNLEDSQVSAYIRQILNGLKYLHEKDVVHRDIKCANILVDARGSVKLADFGLAKVTKLNDIKSCQGSAFWMAPEVVNCEKNGYGLPADIWSLGCTVLEMSTRQVPYYPMEKMQALFRIGKGDPPPVPNSLSSDARDFIFKCLQVNPDNRPTAAQLLEHSFVKRSLQANSHL